MGINNDDANKQTNNYQTDFFLNLAIAIAVILSLGALIILFDIASVIN